MIRLSVVIGTYNRGPGLIRLLESLIKQDVAPSAWEAVVINNNSADDTEELFREFRAANPDFNLSMFKEEKQGSSHTRNRGFAESRADIIAVVDDDQEVNTGFVRAYIELFERHPDAAAAGGKIVPLYDYKVPVWLSKYTERPIAGTLDLGDKVKLFKREAYPGGGNMAVRRQTLDKYGGFRPELGRTGTVLLAGEEKDFFRRISSAGEKIYYTPDAVIWHIIPESKLNTDYFDRATKMVGVSERIRTRGISNAAYRKRLFSEAVKWAGTLVFAVGYGIKGKFSKGRYLLRMRKNITRGLIGKKV